MADNRRQPIVIPFAQGLDQKVDPKHTAPVKLHVVENGQFDKTGRINKRNGFDNLPTALDVSGTSVARMVTVNTRNDELIKVAQQVDTGESKPDEDQGWKVFSLDGASSKWRDIGRHVPIELGIKSIGRPEGFWVAPDMADNIYNDMRAYVWIDDTTTPFLGNGEPRLSIIDTENGQLILDEYEWTWGVAPGFRSPKIIAVDDSFHLWGGGINMLLSIISCASPTAPGAFAAKCAGIVHADRLWDACFCGSGPGGVECSVIAFKDTTPDITVRWYREDGTQVATRTIVSAPINCVSVERLYDHYTGDYYIGVFWQDNASSDIHCFLYDEDSTAHFGANRTIVTLGAVTALNITACEDPSINVTTPAQSAFRAFVEIDDGVRGDWANYIQQGYHRFDEVAGANETTFMNACLASKAFCYGGKARVWTTNAQILQGALHLRSNIGSGETDYIINTDIKALQDKGQSYSTRYPGLPHVTSSLNLRPRLINDTVRTVSVRRDRLGQVGYGTQLHPIKSIVEVSVSFARQTAFAEAMVDKSLHLAGGLVGEIDDRYQETGFHIYPELDPDRIGNVAPYQLPAMPALQYAAVAAGGNLSDGDHYFRFTYEWTDREGQIHRSAPSPVYIVTLALGGAAQLIEFVVPFLHYGDYNKLKDVKVCTYRLASDGIYHKEDIYHQNDLTSGATWLGGYTAAGGSTSDANILDNEILYTEGGVIENIGPPASNIMAARKDRLFLVNEEDPTEVWISKQKESGEGLAFSDRSAFIKRIPTGGPTTALAVLDDKIVLFKENEIRAFSGPGPNNLGVGNFSDDFLVAQDIGCVDRESIANTEKGIVFRSARGIYLLSRNLQPSYIGAGVDDYKDTTVTKTVSVPDKHQIRFITTSGILVLDTLNGQWSLFDHNAIGGTYWQGKFVHYSTAWALFEEDTGFSDNGSDIILTVETAWIKLAGIQGYQRIFWAGINGDYASPHTLNVEIYKDYEAAAMQTIQKAADAVFGADLPYQIRFRPQYSRCQAMKFKIYDSGLSGSGESLSLSALTALVGVRPGLYRDKPTKTL